MGACSISGLVNQQKSGAAASKESLIVLSRGEYSAVPAEAVGLEKDEWIEKSLRVRLYHESAHIVCRARFPGQKLRWPFGRIWRLRPLACPATFGH